MVGHPRPAGTPRAIVDKVNADVAELLVRDVERGEGGEGVGARIDGARF